MANLVFDLARLHVAGVVVAVALEAAEGPQRPEGEAGRQGQGLQGHDQRVAPEQGHEPGHTRGGDPRIDVVVAMGIGGTLVVNVHPQAGQIVHRLAQGGRHRRVAGLVPGGLGDPAPFHVVALAAGAEQVVARAVHLGVAVADEGDPQQAGVPGRSRCDRGPEDDAAIGVLGL